MESQDLSALLEECFKAAQALKDNDQLSDAHTLQYCSSKDALCAELASLLQEAMDMKWPFAPEKWQYKHSVSAADKTNLSDLVGEHLPQLLAVLKSSILAQEARSALAVVFLLDRFLYWLDESDRLLKIVKLLHQRYPDAPVAPQLVIRQARVYLNDGKLRKAEYILSSLINSSGTIGCWKYHSDSDMALVQSVSLQVRGMILQKLGLWREAADLIWASLVGYYSLPQPDKKGIGTSLGILANILVSMNDEDFRAFITGSDIDFSLLGDGSHRLLSAAQAAKMAVVYSQYTSLYVLTNVVAQGTCLLSYSFSVECPASQRQSFLLQAQEAFAIGLLTKTEHDVVTSQQELHTFLKAAYSLTVTSKWLGTPPEVVAQASQACQEAIEKFYRYCQPETQEKTCLSTEIMHQVARVKLLLQVEPFVNSDKGSFIPDSYRNVKDVSVKFTQEGFSEILQRFQQYHESLSKTKDTKCRGKKDEADEPKLCFTALCTTIDAPNTECNTEAGKSERPQAEKLPESRPSGGHLPQNLLPTVGSTDDLSSSWQNFSLSNSGSPQPDNRGFIGNGAVRQGANACNQNYPTTESDGCESDSMPEPADENKVRNPSGRDSGVSSQAVPNSSNASADSGGFEVIQADLETVYTEEDIVNEGAQTEPDGEEELTSLSQLALSTPSSSLSDSFGSKSSWEKISTDHNFSSSGKRQPISRSKLGTDQRSKSQDSDGSFSLLNTTNSENSNSAPDHTAGNHTSGQKASPKTQPAKSFPVDPNMETEIDTESSFEMLETETNPPRERSPLCFSCLNAFAFADVSSAKRFVLSQQDYRALLAGVCHRCLLKRLHSDKTKFKLKTLMTAQSVLQLKFSKNTGLWTARETCAYIGADMELEGAQRRAVRVQFLHQEERLSSYVGKDYKKPIGIQSHLEDVERQMTAQYYVTEFNKKLYDKEDMAQIFFIPSEALLILDGDEIVGCVTVEPRMFGDFVKLTNNTVKTNPGIQATEYGLAFGHFTYVFSGGQEVVVDLQGWVTANGKGLTYLTDPQIHSTKIPCRRSEIRIQNFVEKQHGPNCNGICRRLKLPPMRTRPNVFATN
ncbi:unnamed protein product [Ophioblennius macclurei]